MDVLFSLIDMDKQSGKQSHRQTETNAHVS